MNLVKPLQFRKKMIRAGDASQWVECSSACTRLWVQTPVLPKKKTKTSPRLIITEVVCFTVLNQVFLELLIQVEYALLY